MDGPPSVKDVARHAGVSVGTVSNVLNRPDIVRATTRERVESAILDLGFVRNESARQLRSGTSRLLAYVFLDARNPFFTDVARGAEDVAQERGLALLLISSDGSPTREHDYIDLLLEQRVLGLLITPVELQSPRLESLRGMGMPMVLVDRAPEQETDFPAICSVGVDDVHGGELAVSHLLEEGHRRIAFIGGPLRVPQVQDRLTGARQAIAAAGLPPDALGHVDTPTLNVQAGREAGQRILGLPTNRRPTAAFCANDLVALGLLQQIIQHGASVPDDMAIVGYDDIDFAAAAAVPLTSVRQPRQQLGRSAAEMLLSEAFPPTGGHRHEQIQFTPELVVRNSSAPPKRLVRAPAES